MDADTVAFAKAMIVILVFAGIGMGTFWLWLRARARPHPEIDRLVEDLRAENAHLHAELGARLAELEERLDFAERRLVQERAPAPLPSARIPTPV
jgi:hypothetical protein